MKEILKLDHIQKFYGNEGNVTKAIQDIDFSVQEGEFLGIMGASGSGKTTMLNCISTIDTVSAGHIYLDGTDVTEIKEKAIAKFRRENLGFIFQDFNLLDTLTISENIALALTINHIPVREIEPRVEEIARSLNIADILDKYPYQVSGGQKQRLSIARAIAKHPRVFIFDDSFSALDLKTDAILRKELAANVSDATVIIVAQRISTILHADQILVMDDGKIVGKGTHEELMKTCETYQQIASSQLSAKELGKEA